MSPFPLLEGEARPAASAAMDSGADVDRDAIRAVL
jgi:hypothetical protein